MDGPNDAVVPLERLVALERDNALMLSYILDAHRLSLTLPPNATIDDVNYGAVDVPGMIERLRRNETYDLSRALTASGAARGAAETEQRARNKELTATEKANETASLERAKSMNPFEAMATNTKLGSVGEADTSSAARESAAAVRVDATFFNLDDDAPTTAYSGELALPELYSKLNDAELSELAFEIVATIDLDSEMLEAIRIALDVDEDCANAVQKYAQEHKSSVAEEGISARIHLRSMLAAVKEFTLLEDEAFYKKRCRAMCELLWSRQCDEQVEITDARDQDDNEPSLTASNVLSEINRMLCLPEIDALWVESVAEMIESALDSKYSFSYSGIFGIRLYERLLRVMFDQVEDYALAYDAQDSIKSLERVASSLGLPDETSRGAMLAFAVVKQAIVALEEVGLDYGDDTSPIFSLLSKAREGLDRSQTNVSPQIASAVNSLLCWSMFMLRDFMHTVTPPAAHDEQNVPRIEPDVFNLIVCIAYDSAKMLGKDAEALLREACKQSARAEYKRLRATGMEEDNVTDGDATSASLRIIAQLTASAADSYSAHLERHITSSVGSNSPVTGCFAAQLGEDFKNDLFSWLASGPRLTAQSLETIWSVGDLQNALVATGGDAVEPIRLEEQTSILVFTWLNEKIDDLHKIVDRCISVERWKTKNDAAPVPSAVDFLRAVNETLDGFFGLRIPAHVSALRALTEGIDAAVGKYANAAVLSLGPADDIVPPVPELTRYKKAIVDDLHKKFVAASPPRAPFEEGCVGASTVRLTSLKFLLDKLDSLEKGIISKWNEMQRVASMLRHPNALHEVPKAAWFEDLMDLARQSLRRAIDQVANHMAFSVLYRDLGGAVMHNLYARGVQRSAHNIGTEILPYVNGVLGYVAVRVDSSTRNIVASHLLQATVSAWMRVLLNGGPGRVYRPEDVELLEEEMELVSEFFLAGGQGLDSVDVAARISPMSALCTIVSLPTEYLCGQYLELVEKEKEVPPRESDRDFYYDVYTADVTLRVLCHRAEHAASKWVKAHFSIGKTEGGYSMFGF